MVGVNGVIGRCEWCVGQVCLVCLAGVNGRDGGVNARRELCDAQV